MSRTLQEPIVLQCSTCCVCGVQYAIPRDLWESQIRSGGFHYCPNGHSQGWSEGTDARARKQAEIALQQERQRHDQSKAALRETEAKLKKLEDRTRCACCPCCNRTFKDVRRHLALKHPEYVKSR